MSKHPASSTFLYATQTHFLVFTSALRKFYSDHCFSRASSLAYSTLFALVPVAAITIAIITGFRITNISQADVDRLAEQFFPAQNELVAHVRAEVVEFLKALGQHVLQLGQVSVLVLVVAGIALLNTIQTALNAVWRSTSEANLISKITRFWAVVTMGPLLLAVSFYWYARFGNLTEAETGGVGALLRFVDYIVPIAATWAVLALMYRRIPSAPVALRHASLGALVAAVFFELLKRGFAGYVAQSTTYNNFYGVLVGIPLFLFWLYLIWVIVLFGAEIAYQAGAQSFYGEKYANELGEAGPLLGLRIVLIIAERFLGGRVPPAESEITELLGTDPAIVRRCLTLLNAAGLVGAADPATQSRTLLVAPERISVNQIFAAFRPKRYQAALQPGDETSELLEKLRKAALGEEAKRAVGDWSIAAILRSA